MSGRRPVGEFDAGESDLDGLARLVGPKGAIVLSPGARVERVVRADDYSRAFDPVESIWERVRAALPIEIGVLR